MKIKMDFITNSSSTSFILIMNGELTQENFLNLMGINKNSPLEPIFIDLFHLIEREKEEASQEDIRQLIENSPPTVAEKIRDGLIEGKEVYTGRLSSDGNFIECYFCQKSFEAENKTIYLNYLECVW